MANVNSKCGFSWKFKPLVETWFKTKTGPEFKETLDQYFNEEDAQKVYSKYYKLEDTPIGVVETPVTEVVTPVEANPVEVKEYHNKQTFVINPNQSIDSAYLGHPTDKEQMLRRFRDRIVECCILKINWKTKEVESVDPSSINERIYKYKIDLVNTILKEIDPEAKPYDYNTDVINDELTSIINNVLTTNKALSPEARDAYITLSKFDDLVEVEAPYVKIRKGFKDPNRRIEGVNKYEYVGANVQHFTGWTISDFANSMDQASALARTILTYLPEVVNGKAVKGSSIGLSGFYSCMTAMRDALMYHATDDLIDVREELKKGDKANMYKVIDAYVNYLQRQSEKSIDQYYQTHISYLIGKLNGIKTFLFRSDPDPSVQAIDDTLKSIFKQMFYKNVQMSYIGYEMNSENYHLEGKDLKSSFINNQTYNLLDTISASVYKYRAIKEEGNSLIKDYNIKTEKGVTIFTLGDSKLIIGPKSISCTFDDVALMQLFERLTGYTLPSDFQQVYQDIQRGSFRGPLLQTIRITWDAIHKGSYKASKKNNFPTDLKTKEFSTVAPIGKVLSVIYGSDTANIVKNVTRKNNLPLFGLNSLTYNYPYVMWQHQNDPNSLCKESFLFETITEKTDKKGKTSKKFAQRSLVTAPSVRSEIYFNGTLKSVDSFTFSEVMYLSLFGDFYQKVADPKSSIVTFQNATFSDKSTHFLINYRLDEPIIKAGGKTLRTMINDAMKGNSTGLFNLLYNTRRDRAKQLVKTICDDYNAVYGTNFTTLNDIAEFAKTKKYADIARDFANKKVDFYEEIHLSKPKKSDYGVVNNDILLLNESTKTTDALKARLDQQKKIFLKDLIKNGFNLNVHTNKAVEDLGKKFPKWIDDNGNLILAKVGDQPVNYNRFTADGLINDTSNITLHPMLDAYFMSDVLLSNEYNEVMIGGEYAHPGNTESQRLIAQIKRSVIFGATQHSFAQGLANGVADEIKMAIMPSLPASVRNIYGEEDNGFKGLDGSTAVVSLQSRLESNSLLDARVGHDKKTIGHDIDPRTGKPILLKHAAFEMTNAKRRVSAESIVSQEKLTKMCYSHGQIDVDLEFLMDQLSYQDVYFYRPEDGYHYKIQSFIKNEDGTYSRELIRVDENGNTISNSQFQSIGNIDTLWDLEQAFGGCWVKTAVDGKLKYSETNVDVLERFVTIHQEAKNAMIAYVVDKSAIKVGAGNVNEMNAWYGNTKLRYITMRTRYLGVQMNAEHELEDSDVTEMTQMISALSQNGYYSEVVNEIYQDIGAVVAEALAEFKTAIGNPTKIYKLLGKAFVDSFRENDRDTIGLAQAFVLKATEALKSENPEYRIPFSAETVSGLFISTVSSMITKKGIRRKYDGFAGVLTPAFNQIQYYNVGGKPYLYEKFTKLVHEKGIKGYVDEFGIQHSAINVAMNDYRLQDGTLNPFLKPISQNKIDFEDTVVLRYINENGEEVFEEHYVQKYADYDALKHNQLPEGVEIFVFESKPKNLKDIDTKFEINGLTYSLHDLDSVRAAFYVRNQKELDDEQKFVLKSVISKITGNLLTPRLQGKSLSNVQLTKEGNNFVTKGIARSGTEVSAQYVYSENEGFKKYTLTGSRSAALRISNGDVGLTVEEIIGPEESFASKKYYQEVISDVQDGLIISEIVIRPNGDIFIRTENQIGIEGDAAKTIYKKIVEYTNYQNSEEILKDPENALKIIRKRIQSDLRALDKGKPIMLNGQLVTAENVRIVPGQAVSGRYHAKPFMLEDGDSVSDVKEQGVAFFEAKLRAKYTMDNDIPEDLCDVVLFTTKAEQYMVKVASDAEIEKLLKEDAQITRDESIEKIGDKYYIGEDKICDSDGVTFCKYTSVTGETKRLILVNDKDKIKSLKQSKYFDFARYRNPVNERSYEAEEHWFDTWVKNRAQRMYESFLMQLQIISTRIPSQGMPSFMLLEIIDFTDSDINDFYTPVGLLKKAGADLDIDKQYNLGLGVSDAGIVYTNSKLIDSPTYKLSDLLRLKTPNGAEYQDGEISDDHITLTDLDLRTKNWVDLINLVMNYTTVSIDTQDVKLKDKFFRDLNIHTQTVLSDRDKQEAVKNIAAFNMKQVVGRVQNQLISQISVDTSMDSLKEVAKKSSLSEDEKYMTSDNPATKFLMQVQNMIGKQVIGVTAVSLKQFFAKTAFWNQYVNEFELEDTDASSALRFLYKMLKYNPLKKQQTPLANINLRDLIEDVEEIGYNFDFGDEGFVINDIVFNDFLSALKYLQEVADTIDCVEAVSALLSAATDNAKELILAKLNAGPSLADIYTYLFSLGCTAEEVGEIMESPEFSFIVSMADGNIFGVPGMRISNAISTYLGEQLISSIDSNIYNYIFGTYDSRVSQYDSTKQTLELLKVPENVDKAISITIGLLDEMRKSYGADNEGDFYADMGMYDEMMAGNMAGDAVVETTNTNTGPIKNRNFDKNPIKPAELKRMLDILFIHKQILECRDHYENAAEQNLRMMVDEILPGVEEQQILGALAGINTGLKTKTYEKRKWVQRIENYVNDLFPYDKKAKENEIPFSFKTFMEDSEYRQRWIWKLNGKKVSDNVLEVITNVPHYWAMLESWYMDLYMIEHSVSRFVLENKVADNIKPNRTYSYKESEWKQIQKYVSDVLIYNWITTSGLEFTIPKDSGIKIYSATQTLVANTGEPIKLNTPQGIATFKRYMEDYVIPTLKKTYNNDFFRALDLGATEDSEGLVYRYYKLPLPMMNIDASPKLEADYANYLRAFNAVAGDTFNEWKIGDLFYMYNLIVNKDSFGQHSLTRLFEDLAAGNENTLVNSFNQWLSEFDSRSRSLDELKMNLDDVIYRIDKYVDNSSIRPKKQNIKNNPDFTFELPSILKTKKIVNKTKSKTTETFTPMSERQAILNNLIHKSMGIVALTEEDYEDGEFLNSIGLFRLTGLDEFSKQQKAFIAGGKIFVNSWKMDVSDPIHEYAHLVLAGLKWNSNEGARDYYYGLISSVVNHPMYNEIAERYKINGEYFLHGSDLQEEVFVNLFQMYLQNHVFNNDNILDKLINATDIPFGTDSEVMILFVQALGGIIEGLEEPDFVDFIDEMISYAQSPGESEFAYKTSQRVAEMKHSLINDKVLDLKCE